MVYRDTAQTRVSHHQGNTKSIKINIGETKCAYYGASAVAGTYCKLSQQCDPSFSMGIPKPSLLLSFEICYHTESYEVKEIFM